MPFRYTLDESQHSRNRFMDPFLTIKLICIFHFLLVLPMQFRHPFLAVQTENAQKRALPYVFTKLVSTFVLT